MENVPGVPITDYCHQKRLKTRERLELFVKVCEGVPPAPHRKRKYFLGRDFATTPLCFHGVDVGLELGYGCDILRVRVRRLGASICRAPHPTRLPSYYENGEKATQPRLMC